MNTIKLFILTFILCAFTFAVTSADPLTLTPSVADQCINALTSSADTNKLIVYLTDPFLSITMSELATLKRACPIKTTYDNATLASKFTTVGLSAVLC